MKSSQELPSVTPWFAKRFTDYSRWYVRRRFHAVRVLRSSTATLDRASAQLSGRPLVVYLNHASWWDPLVSLLLADAFFRERTCFAPIAADHLERYRFFRHLGFYGVTERNARGFLRTTGTLLDSPQHAVWLTPQGRFADVRERPLKFAPGLGAVARLRPDAAYLPLAIDYTFWTEPQPEILIAFGTPIVPMDHAPTDDWTAVLEQALATTQDALAAKACRRDAADWQALEQGARGVNPIYDGWRWLRARFSGEEFTRGHRAEVAK